MSTSIKADRVFAEDPATIPLKERKACIRARLREITFENLNENMLLPQEAPSHWPPEAKELLESYHAISQELARLNSKRESQRLSRFLRASNGEEEMTQAARLWWMNRY